MRWSAFPCFVVIVAVFFAVRLAAAAGITISTDTDWPEGDHVYDNVTVNNGAKLRIAGGSTVTVSGTLLVTEGSIVLLQGKNVDAKVGGLWVGEGVAVVSLNVTVDAGSKISADGQGYLGGTCAVGLGPAGGWANNGNGSGGGHGGLGGGAYPGAVYGTAVTPTTPGSGGGHNLDCTPGGTAGAGGGVIRLHVPGALTLNGLISANGGEPATSESSAGAGGSVYVTANALGGSGAFEADGGSAPWSSCGGGGGGRIAVYYVTGGGFTGFASSTALGGPGSAGNGLESTVGFFRVTDIANHTMDPSTDLYVYRLFHFDAPGSAFTFAGIHVGAAGSPGALLTFEGGLTLDVTGLLEVKNGSTLLLGGKNTEGQVGGEWVGEGVTINSPTVTVDLGSRISADGQGYLGGACAYGIGPGGGWADGGNGSGGTHGGLGGWWSYPGGNPGTIYGTAIAPTDPGSGGGHNTDCQPGGRAGAGGGVIRLDVMGTLTLNGTISANGANTATSESGAGAGGSVYVTANALAGSGAFAANGGSAPEGSSGGGGGGRLAVYYVDGAGFTGFANSTAHGGSGPAGSGQEGTAGVFHVGDLANHTTDPSRVLYVFHLFRYEVEATTLALANIHIGPAGSSGAMLKVEGGSTMVVAGTLDVTNGSTLFLQGKNTEGQVGGEWMGEGVTIQALDVTVGAGSKIFADGQGYSGGPCGQGLGPGGGGGDTGNASGGTYGGLGGWLYPGPVYGTAVAPTDPGSAGGHNTDCWPVGSGGAGGGVIRLDVSGTLTLDGSISANGGDSVTGESGGGAGGSLLITANALGGSGTFEAIGGSAPHSSGGGGGGGRIAVYYAAGNGFSGFAQSSARGGTGTLQDGEDGTTAFFEVADLVNPLTDPSRTLRIFETFRYDQEDTEVSLRAIDVGSAATTGSALVVEGGSVLNIAETLTVTGDSTVFVLSKSETALVDEDWAGQGVTINAGDLTVEAGSGITADAQGYAGRPCGTGMGPGGGGADSWSGSGGSHGGVGGGSFAPPTCGSPITPEDLGSAGGGNADCGPWGKGGPGGGAIHLNVPGTLTLDGSISADGGSASGDEAGGGSGGSVFVAATTLAGSGGVSADGGPGSACCSGGGGGGRIAFHYAHESGLNPPATFTVAGGPGADWNGSAGTIYLNTMPMFRWIRPREDVLHDTETLGWEALAVDPGGVTVEVLAAGDSGTDSLGAGAPCRGTLSWDTTSADDGRYELQAVFRDASSEIIGETTRQVLVQNSVDWHSGTLAGHESWAAGSVHVVEANIVVPSGVTLTIDPAAIVKFVQGVKIVVQDGGILNAPGGAADPIVLTALPDDSAGGDTNLDGNQSVPTPGWWRGLEAEGTGQIQTNEYVSVRYAQRRHSGTLTCGETWPGTWAHRVTGIVESPAGCTLTIEPGAVVKFDDHAELNVRPGGSLVAEGTLAEPITFTSVKDDTVGGDTNLDGNTTEPYAGDWRWIYLDAASASLDHATIKYGGGTSSGYWGNTGVIRTDGSSTLTLANSFVEEAFFDGVLTLGGTVTITSSVFHGIDRAICAHPGSTVVVTNATLDDNRIGILGHGGAMTIVNTVVSNSFEYGVLNTSSVIAIASSDVWSTMGTNYGGLADPTGTNGNISVYPRYRNTAQGNYRLVAGSPCIDAADGTAAPATDLADVMRYDDPATPNTGTPTPGGAYADMGAYEYAETAASAIDLVVGSVSGAAAAVAGNAAKVQWTVTNVGAAAAVGPWYDSVFLVPDGATTGTIASRIRVAQGVTLGPGATLDVTGWVRVPGGAEGPYRWQVRTNSRGEVFEGANWNNNTTLAASVTNLSVPEIPVDGDPLVRSFGLVAQNHWFKLSASAGQDVVVRLDLVGSGAIELFVARGRMPTPQSFDIKNHVANVADPVAVIPAAPAPQTWYVLAYPVTLSHNSQTFTIEAETITFSLDGASPGSVGNAGASTFAITGGQLREDCQYEIVNPTGSAAAATRVEWVDSTLVRATFDLTGAAIGDYDVRVTCSGSPLTLDDAIAVAEGSGPEVYMDLVGRTIVRAGRSNRFTLVFGNQGDGDTGDMMMTFDAPAGVDVEFQGGDARFYPSGETAERQAFTGMLASLPPGTSGLVPLTLTFHYEGVHTFTFEALSGFPVLDAVDRTASAASTILDEQEGYVSLRIDITSSTYNGLLSTTLTISDASGPADPALALNETVDELECTLEATVDSGELGRGAIDWQKLSEWVQGGKQAYDKGKGIEEAGPAIRSTLQWESIDEWLLKCGCITPAQEAVLNDDLKLDTAAKLVEALSQLPGRLSRFDAMAKYLSGVSGRQWKEHVQDYADAYIQEQRYDDSFCGVDPLVLRSEGEKAFRDRLFGMYLDYAFDDECPPAKLARGRQSAQARPSASDSNPCPPGSTTGGGAVDCRTSNDPNLKVGPASVGERGFISGKEMLLYTIFFENMATATAPAQEVVVTDKLGPNLDGSTFELVSIGFNNESVSIPIGLSHYETTMNVDTDPNPVNVSATFDYAAGTATWRMSSADLVTGDLPEDPFAGFLPPNVEPCNQCGEGYVSYVIWAKPGLASGTEIDNDARILFDVNAPIDTNMVTNTIDLDPPTSWMDVLPPESGPQFVVSWGGEDGSGSGVACYDVFVSEDGGAFVPWLTCTPNTADTFVGQAIHTYSFYVVAIDAVGNRGATPTGEQVTTDTLWRKYLPLVLAWGSHNQTDLGSFSETSAQNA